MRERLALLVIEKGSKHPDVVRASKMLDAEIVKYQKAKNSAS
ncbi:aspartyl-phosphate phosphatase Spo0E family protein [Desulforamulus ferrireducens]